MQVQSSPAISRRDAMRLGLFGAAGLLLTDSRAPASAPTTRPAKAKAVIQIWLWGGPAHLDTFDPKPEAGNDYCGPLNHPISTNVDGIRICELLPLLAKQADKYAIIRSMTHGVNGHETASYLVQTPLRHAGLALATSSVSAASFLLLLWAMRRKIGSVNGGELWSTFWKTSAGGVVMGCLCFTSSGLIHQWLGMATHRAAFVDLAVSIPLGVAVYFAICKWLGVEAIERVREMIVRKVRS